MVALIRSALKSTTTPFARAISGAGAIRMKHTLPELPYAYDVGLATPATLFLPSSPSLDILKIRETGGEGERLMGAGS